MKTGPKMILKIFRKKKKKKKKKKKTGKMILKNIPDLRENRTQNGFKKFFWKSDLRYLRTQNEMLRGKHLKNELLKNVKFWFTWKQDPKWTIAR